MALQLQRIKSGSAAEIAASCELEDAGRAVLDPADSPGAFLEKLLAARAFHDAVRFLASALPPRESIGWACLCVRRLVPLDPETPAKIQLDATERWVRAPGDESRRAALDAATRLGPDSPTGLLATAAFFSGGSIAPAGMQETPPPEGVYARLVSGCIFLAAIPGDPVTIPDRLRACLDLALNITRGHAGSHPG
jgi:hypothetical protein